MEHGAWSRTQSANRRERNSREKAQEDGWASLQNYGGVVILRRKITKWPTRFLRNLLCKLADLPESCPLVVQS